MNTKNGGVHTKLLMSTWHGKYNYKINKRSFIYDIKSIRKITDFIQNDWGQHDIIKVIIKLNKQGITQPKYSNTTKYINYIYTYKTGLDQLVKW